MKKNEIMILINYLIGDYLWYFVKQFELKN